MSHGKLLSTYYLFETSIQDACKAAPAWRPRTLPTTPVWRSV
ncbi:hypothetical protein [Streptomyces sp. NPDC055692]